MTDEEKKRKALEKIARELAHDCPCPLKATAKNPVPGEGSPNAALFFIGEAPGRNEDETGRPFVGAAGKILAELLGQIGLTREEVFITSIEKFRPPNNRDPKPEEIAACFPYLERQIEIIQPKFIVTLGRHALRRMLEWEAGKELPPPSMEALHGRAFNMKKGYVLFPIHHPAAILYNRKLRETVESDLRKLGKLVKNIRHSEPAPGRAKNL